MCLKEKKSNRNLNTLDVPALLSTALCLADGPIVQYFPLDPNVEMTDNMLAVLSRDCNALRSHAPSSAAPMSGLE